MALVASRHYGLSSKRMGRVPLRVKRRSHSISGTRPLAPASKETGSPQHTRHVGNRRSRRSSRSM